MGAGVQLLGSWPPLLACAPLGPVPVLTMAWGPGFSGAHLRPLMRRETWTREQVGHLRQSVWVLGQDVSPAGHHTDGCSGMEDVHSSYKNAVSWGLQASEVRQASSPQPPPLPVPHLHLLSEPRSSMKEPQNREEATLLKHPQPALEAFRKQKESGNPPRNQPEDDMKGTLPQLPAGPSALAVGHTGALGACHQTRGSHLLPQNPGPGVQSAHQAQRRRSTVQT